ncbi:hypothetical protein GC177_10185 [bacterium]|nr:hypothetical protein [bacterium]
MSDSGLATISNDEWNACLDKAKQVYAVTRLITFPRLVLFSNMWSPEAEILMGRLLHTPHGPAEIARGIFDVTHEPFFAKYYSQLKISGRESALLKMVEDGAPGKLMGRLKMTQHFLELQDHSPEEMVPFIEAFDKTGGFDNQDGKGAWLPLLLQTAAETAVGELNENRDMFLRLLVLATYVAEHIGTTPGYHPLWDPMHVHEGAGYMLANTPFEPLSDDWQSIQDGLLQDMQQDPHWQPLMLTLAAQALRRGFGIEAGGHMAGNEKLGEAGSEAERHQMFRMYPCAEQAVYKTTDMPANRRTAYFIERIANDNKVKLTDYSALEKDEIAELAYQAASALEDMAEQLLSDEASPRSVVLSEAGLPVYPSLNMLNPQGNLISLPEAMGVLCNMLAEKGYESTLLHDVRDGMADRDGTLLGLIADGFKLAYSIS